MIIMQEREVSCVLYSWCKLYHTTENISEKISFTAVIYSEHKANRSEQDSSIDKNEDSSAHEKS